MTFLSSVRCVLFWDFVWIIPWGASLVFFSFCMIDWLNLKGRRRERIRKGNIFHLLVCYPMLPAASAGAGHIQVPGPLPGSSKWVVEGWSWPGPRIHLSRTLAWRLRQTLDTQKWDASAAGRVASGSTTLALIFFNFFNCYLMHFNWCEDLPLLRCVVGNYETFVEEQYLTTSFYLKKEKNQSTDS